MTYRFQYQAKAEPVFLETTLDKWFQPISVPVRQTAAALALAALASTTMAIESKIPLPPGETPEILDWMVQQPDPVREIASAVVDEWFTYESYCFTSIGGTLRTFSFPQQTGAFIATFSAKANGPNPDGATIYIGDSPSLLASAYAIHVQFTTVGRDEIIVSNGGTFENDVEFTWIAGTVHKFEVRVNLESHVCTVFVDGTLIATNFDFFAGQGGVTDLDHWALSSTGGIDTIEVCDFRAVPDNSATEIVPTYEQSQPFPAIKPVILAPVPFQFEETDIVFVPGLDTWFVQRPEQILVPPRPVDEGYFTIDADLLTQPETIFLDKWYQPLSEPIFLPVRMEHLSPTILSPPLGALPLAGVATQTLTTMLKTFVSVKGTKFKIQIRQTEGSPVLETVQQRSVLSVAFHPRSILLANNTLVQNRESGGVGYDAEIEGGVVSGTPRVFDRLRARESGSGGNANAHICLEFNVTAFEGVIYRSVKLRLTNHDSFQGPSNQPFNSIFRCARIVQPWALSTGDVTYDQYDRNLTSPDGDWQLDGGRGSPDDRAEVVDWVDPRFPTPFAVDTFTQSPDLTVLVNNAIMLNSGILKLMVQKKQNSSGSSIINDFYSSREPGITDAQKPHLFFDAF